jgi:hypothetical protein
MPNWCFSQVVIEGNHQEVKTLHDIMDNLSKMKEPLIANGFGTTWLGCLVNAIGKDCNKVYCRGSWSDLQMEVNGDVGILKFSTETAWRPMLEVFQAICDTYKSMSYFFLSEESGMGEYYTNDINKKYFRERYIADICTPQEEYETEYFETLEDTLAYLQENENIELKTLNDVELLEQHWQDINPDSYCSVHEFQLIN